MILRRALLCAALALACAASGMAAAQTYPSKAIRIVVGFSPGGPADVMARLIGQRLTATLGQPVVVDNRPGAGGTIGARAIAESDPDGYTLLLGNTSTLVIGPLIYRQVGYDPVKGFAPVALLGTTSNLMIVNPAVAAKSVQELIALARANPGKLNFSSAGLGTPPHLIGEMFKQRLKLDVVHVPYKSGGLSVAAVVSGETQFSFENPAVSLPLVQAGTVRGLAVTNDVRSTQAPELPTMIEAGVPDFTSVSFTAVVAPAGTPAAIVGKLNAAINESLTAPEVTAAFARLGAEVQPGPPQAFGAFLAAETQKWSTVGRTAGLSDFPQ